MSKVCQNCGKTVMRGNKVARARQELTYRAPKVFKPNLHTARIMQPDGSKIKMTLCTKCLRMMKQYAAKAMAEQAAQTPKSK
ncbi:50S ribosomal protein L28 [Candidatus Beckwithbacteria bacterium]|nr:50S ribosomal protein L28 [Candidatus Beckwithbacteria bacterium]